ncbi:DUF4817 domain-containing protein [Trichonephila clavipes]|nr:DUF4817 domain-containing protein [Trichonephila clavipes]
METLLVDFSYACWAPVASVPRIIDAVVATPQDVVHSPGVKITFLYAAPCRTVFSSTRTSNHGQVTRTTPELAPPLLTTTPHQREEECPKEPSSPEKGLELQTDPSGNNISHVQTLLKKKSNLQMVNKIPLRSEDQTYRLIVPKHQWNRTKVMRDGCRSVAPANESCQVIYSQFGLAIHPNDHQARRRFVEWAQNEIAVAPDFHKRSLFSDEAHFWLNGYVNKQNCRIWSEANPQVYVETPLHPEKLTVWCALWAGGIIGPYFFKNDEGHNVTINGDRYRAMITNFFIPELNNHDVQELWFQQDGATCHTARATIDLLKDTFGDRLISRFGPMNWPPRSCDLTPLDYFLWGYVKSLVYADKPQTLDHLEDNIRRVIADIRPQMLERVIENWTSRLDYIRASRGSPMPEIIFKM